MFIYIVFSVCCNVKVSVHCTLKPETIPDPIYIGKNLTHDIQLLFRFQNYVGRFGENKRNATFCGVLCCL